MAITSRSSFVAMSCQVYCCSFPSNLHQLSAHTLHFNCIAYQCLLHVCTGVEADVPCSCDIQLSPECLDENWELCESIHPPLCPVPPDTHFCDPEMVVQVEICGKIICCYAGKFYAAKSLSHSGGLRQTDKCSMPLCNAAVHPLQCGFAG